MSTQAEPCIPEASRHLEKTRTQTHATIYHLISVPLFSHKGFVYKGEKRNQYPLALRETAVALILDLPSAALYLALGYTPRAGNLGKEAMPKHRGELHE